MDRLLGHRINRFPEDQAFIFKRIDMFYLRPKCSVTIATMEDRKQAHTESGLEPTWNLPLYILYNQDS